MAAGAEVETLILTHTGPELCRPGSKERAIGDISDIFKGEIIFGEELMRLELW
jgi:ribonuclease Z